MNVAVTVENGRVAPCFAGVELWIIGPQQNPAGRLTIPTAGREPLFWVRDLARHDVDTLLCAGIDVFAWGAFRGNGIRVVPEAVGSVQEVLDRWRAGRLKAASTWPPVLKGRLESRGHRARRRRRYRRQSGRI